ncbi:MAG TPA: hypothetical protein VG871_02820, partial [Vicinamibacterales bacterium]|nr:hypothetical protein [Vicinamibacterales bacterium]
MALRRLLVLAFALVAAPLSTRVWAQPTTGSAGSGSAADAGSAVEPIEEPPPSEEQMNGTTDNPDAPHAVFNQSNEPKPAAQPMPAKAVYPVEFSRRPITLTENLIEVSITPHFQVSPFQFS